MNGANRRKSRARHDAIFVSTWRRKRIPDGGVGLQRGRKNRAANGAPEGVVAENAPVKQRSQGRHNRGGRQVGRTMAPFTEARSTQLICRGPEPAARRGGIRRNFHDGPRPLGGTDGIFLLTVPPERPPTPTRDLPEFPKFQLGAGFSHAWAP